MGRHFTAPWGTPVKLVTGGVIALAFAIGGTQSPATGGVLLALAIGAAAYGVWGYSVDEDQIKVLRLGWATRFDLADLEDVRVEPGAMMGSIRTFGNGGLFGLIGRFHNGILGSYRAYATNTENTVVLDFGSQRIVVTPNDPHGFVEAVRREMNDGASADPE